MNGVAKISRCLGFVSVAGAFLKNAARGATKLTCECDMFGEKLGVQSIVSIQDTDNALHEPACKLPS